MSDITKGDWKVKRAGYPVGTDTTIVTTKDRCICKIHMQDQPKSVANAKLIAVAPKLLKDAKDTVAWFKSQGYGVEGKPLPRFIGNIKTHIEATE